MLNISLSLSAHWMFGGGVVMVHRRQGTRYVDEGVVDLWHTPCGLTAAASAGSDVPSPRQVQGLLGG